MTKSGVMFSIMMLTAIICSACGSNDNGTGDQPDGDIDIESDENNSEGDYEFEDTEAISENSEEIDGDSDNLENNGEEHNPDTLEPEAGFIEIEPVSYYFEKGKSRQDLESSKAFIWYVFQPANENPEDKPLIVFFNGGPGSATGLLFGFNTGNLSMDPQLTGEEDIIESPASWATLGNLMYIDARQTGFSYCTMDDVDEAKKRSDEFTSRNFNAFFDGADFIRVLLRFMAAHPVIKDNKVMIAGESYGGIRSTVMLNILQNYPRYANGGSIYQDSELVNEIQAHVDGVFPDYTGMEAPPEVMAQQFGLQVLIQPLLSGMYQDEEAGLLWEEDGSPLYQIAEETGVPFIPCKNTGDPTCDPHNNALIYVMNYANRDVYNYSKPYYWMDDLSNIVTTRLLQYDNLSEMIGFEASDIEPMYAINRDDAYRISYLDDDKSSSVQAYLKDERIPLLDRLTYHNRLKTKAKGDDDALEYGNLPDTFGELQPWDRYYVSLQYLVNTAYYINDLILYGVDPFSPVYGELFLENLLHTKTFITNAAYDLVIYAPSLASALERHTDLVSSVEWTQEPIDGEARGGWLKINYADKAFGLSEAPQPAKVRFPLYAESCHAVEVTEPVELLEDVTEWLSEVE